MDKLNFKLINFILGLIAINGVIYTIFGFLITLIFILSLGN